ncbi:MAG: hypothetical protein IJ146_03645 [Kiritimatiellae bacterium]|nr:hypothetical protein [Kiritimatiellia bacterium]
MAARARLQLRRSLAWTYEDEEPLSFDVDDGASHPGVPSDQVDGWRLMRILSEKGLGNLSHYTRRQRIRRRQTRFLVTVAALFVLWCIFRFV